MRADLPPGRYDPPSRRNRILAGALGGLLGLAALLAAYSVYSRHQAGQLESELLSYKVLSDSSVHITFSVVTRGKPGECKVRARDRTGVETGAEIVRVEPSGKRSQVVSVDLPTKTRAVTGELIGCRPL